MKRVIIGMSGGVDSSVAAHLLKEKGCEVIGVTLRLWDKSDDGLGEGVLTDEIGDAKEVAARLGIEHHVLDYREVFKKEVVDSFINEYLNGRTPNPCIVCNRQIKWGQLEEAMRQFNADTIATGHYAKIIQTKSGRYSIKRAKDEKKDQTYVLYRLTQEQLKHTYMPLSSYTKEDIRGIAESLGLSVADKKDSQDICFIPDKDYVSFIKRFSGIENRPGNFVDKEGCVLGEHKGIMHYTVGQRKGLGIALGKRTFVLRIDALKNEVVLGDDVDAYTDCLFADEINMLSEEMFSPDRTYTAKIRYSDSGEKCTVAMVDKDIIRVDFASPVRAVTPGQAVVFYDGDIMVGGGTIL